MTVLVTNMVEPLDARKTVISRRVAVCGALVGALALGLMSGELLAGARPFDWTLEIMELIFDLGLTIWFAIVAARRDTGPSN
jgi:hypothetical protein